MLGFDAMTAVSSRVGLLSSPKLVWSFAVLFKVERYLK
jgi:hypothetical protein